MVGAGAFEEERDTAPMLKEFIMANASAHGSGLTVRWRVAGVTLLGAGCLGLDSRSTY